jgi:hypothetical protein
VKKVLALLLLSSCSGVPRYINGERIPCSDEERLECRRDCRLLLHRKMESCYAGDKVYDCHCL